MTSQTEWDSNAAIDKRIMDLMNDNFPPHYVAPTFRQLDLGSMLEYSDRVGQDIWIPIEKGGLSND